MLCCILSLIRWTGNIFMVVEGFLATSLNTLEDTWGWLFSAMLSLGACVDVVITATLCYYLKKHDLAFKRFVNYSIYLLCP